MKRFIFSAICLLATGIASHAQINNVDSSYKDYVGKYDFEPGEPVEEVDIRIQDTSLVANAGTGDIILKKLGIDSFAVHADGAAAVAFKRDSAGKVTNLILYTFSGRAVPAKKQQPNIVINKELVTGVASSPIDGTVICYIGDDTIKKWRKGNN